MRFWLRFYCQKPRLWWVARKRRRGTLRPCLACLSGRCQDCNPRWGCTCFEAACNAAAAADRDNISNQEEGDS